jgi:polyhydroxyalkanoate synthesis regulator phasin
MKKPGKNERAGIEGWIDEQIQLALAGLAHPFEKRIARLRERIQDLQKRVREISAQVDGEPVDAEGRPSRNHPDEENR